MLQRGAAVTPVTTAIVDARLEDDLRVAIARGEVTLVFQPIVDLHDGRITQLEALVRWNHPLHGAVTAARLVALADGSALRTDLGRCVLRGACAAVARWREAGVEAPPVSLNVSPRELTRPGFVQEAVAICGAAGVAPKAIAFEIIGTLRSPLPGSLPAVIDELHAEGFWSFLDDFCSGSMSVQHLEHLRVKGVKLGRSVASRVEDDAYPRALLAAILAMGQALGLQLIVDGIETPAQAEALRALGYRQGQGWLFSRPLPADRIPDLLLGRAPLPGTAEDQTMSLGAAVEVLGVSASTVRRRIADGHLAASRTQGGHRRLRRSDVERERRRTYHGPVARAPQAPGDRLPRIGEILLERGHWIRDVALRYVYVGDDHGWFGTPRGRSELDRWLVELGGGMSSGNFEQAAAATSFLLGAARDAGVPLSERVSLLDGIGQAARAGLSSLQVRPAELRDWIRVGRVLRQLAFQGREACAVPVGARPRASVASARSGP